MHWGIVSSLPGLYPLNVVAPPSHQLWQPKMSPGITKCLLDTRVALVENTWPRGTLNWIRVLVWGGREMGSGTNRVGVIPLPRLFKHLFSGISVRAAPGCTCVFVYRYLSYPFLLIITHIIHDNWRIYENRDNMKKKVHHIPLHRDKHSWSWKSTILDIFLSIVYNIHIYLMYQYK